MEKLFVIGHSLGAAMAVLAAAKIHRDEPSAIVRLLSGVYTFGQPAVGDVMFANTYRAKFGDRLYRHEYAFDAVPRLPPGSTGVFEHFGEVRIAIAAKQGWLSTDVAKTQARGLIIAGVSVCLSFVGRRIQGFTALERLLCKYSLFDDHSPKRYIEASRSALLTT